MPVTIRKATEADIPSIAQIHMDSWRNTYRGMMPDDFLDNLKLSDRVARWTERYHDEATGEFVYVAVAEDGTVVGFGSGLREPTGDYGYDGELRALHVMLPYQRHGLGKKLIAAVTNHLAEMGMTSMLVWVLAQNPACAFYEGLGGAYVARREEPMAGALIEEVAYGWKDTTAPRGL